VGKIKTHVEGEKEQGVKKGTRGFSRTRGARNIVEGNPSTNDRLFGKEAKGLGMTRFNCTRGKRKKGDGCKKVMKRE